MRLGLLTVHPLQSSSEDDGLSRYRTAALDRLHCHDAHLLQKSVERLLIVFFEEEIGSGLGDDIADSVNVVDLLARLASRRGMPGRLAKSLKRLERARQSDRIGFADMADAERENETIQRDLPPSLDGGKKLLGRELSKTFEILDFRQAGAVAFLQRENIGGRLDQPLLIEKGDLPVSEPFDIEGVARAKMAQLFHRPRRF